VSPAVIWTSSTGASRSKTWGGSRTRGAQGSGRKRKYKYSSIYGFQHNIMHAKVSFSCASPYLEAEESSLTDLTNSSPCFGQEGVSIAYPPLTVVYNCPTNLPTGLNLPGSIIPSPSSISLRMWIYLTDARKSVAVTIEVFGSLISKDSSNLNSGQLWCSAI